MSETCPKPYIAEWNTEPPREAYDHADVILLWRWARQCEIQLAAATERAEKAEANNAEIVSRLAVVDVKLGMLVGDHKGLGVKIDALIADRDRLAGIVERLRKTINAVVNGFYAARSGRLGGQQLTNAEYDEVMQTADYAIDTLVEDSAAEAALTKKETTLPPCPRKCEVCAGSDHHWLDGFSNDDDGDAENPGDPVLVCKHCGVMRPWVDLEEGSDK